MSRRRFAWAVAGGLAGVAAIAVVTAVLVVRSNWFFEKVRTQMVATVETATGGRVEIGSFAFDWKQLRAEVRSVTLHGNEPPDKPPLFRASSIAVGLKIVSLLRRDVDVQYIDVADPRLYLIFYPDGHTNMPAPKIKEPGRRTPAETILNLAAGRFSAQRGVLEIESRGQTPFDVRGQNLDARFEYDLAGPRYRGNISVQPLDARWEGHAPPPFGLTMAVALERNRVAIDSARLEMGQSAVSLAGAVEDLASPRAALRYEARVTTPDAARLLGIRLPERGSVQSAGNASWGGGADFSIAGNWHAAGVDYRDSNVQLRGFRADGGVKAGLTGIDLSGVRFSGEVSSAGGKTAGATSGNIAAVSVRGSDLDFNGVSLGVLGGSFRGTASLQRLQRFTVEGDIAGFEARRAVAVYHPVTLPWDGLVSGQVRLTGRLEHEDEFHAEARLSVAPATGSAPVHGDISATYDAGSGILDLGRSTLSLPSSRVEVSGAIGSRLNVHLQTRDLNDLLPVLGESARSLPVKLAPNGAAIFDGTVSGKLENPQIAGRLAVTHVAWSGETFDSLQAGVTASPANLRLADGTLARGALRAQFEFAAGLQEWNADSNSAIFGHGSIRNADVAELASLLHVAGVPLSGTLDASGQIAGTVGQPLVAADIEIAHGTLREEPFDRFTAHATSSGRAAEVTAGQLIAGVKQVRLRARFEYAADRFDAGVLRFEVATNVMPLDQVRTVQQQHPGLRGTLAVTADGSFNLDPSHPPGFRVAALHAQVAARSLELSAQPLGDLNLTADSQGPTLRAHLDSDFAGSAIRGDGEWSLEGDYPGNSTVTFSKLDLDELHDWLAASPAGTPKTFEGSAEGALRLSGPALDPGKMTAELSISQLTIAPPAGVAPAGTSFAMNNSGPVTARLANSAITVDNAHLVGRSTDLGIAGKVLLEPKPTLDLRVNGRVDLAILHDWNRDFTATGTVATDATVRGPLDALQVGGRMEFHGATFNIADFPNGLSNASGVISFTRDRATIQSFTGETGGGSITLSGFAGLGGGPIIFRLHAQARQMRVRYPEGVSTLADANLNFTGTSDRSMLAGTVTIRRTGFNPQSDFSSLLASSAQPVRTPSARAGLLAGLNFDVQIGTAPDIRVESSLTQDVQLEANLRLRGTATNPALLGRVNITQGQVVFFGTKYNINQGSISFFNPARVEPIVDIDLETKARGIEVTLTISGPLDKPNLTPRSDPPLQFNEIVALLASGQAPTSEPQALVQQTTSPQNFGASALLGQAIASPVAGRLQRFFGVSRIRIDPTLPGLQYNPQARLTLEQQITPDITFTYVTNVTTTNPQVVSVEWDLSKQWSAVAIREENGLFGLDFFFKKQFK